MPQRFHWQAMIGLRAVFAILTCFLALPLTAIAAAAATFYVSTTGNDANSGASSQPWRTIQKAANTVPAGSTVLVRSGIYGERVTVGVSGSAAAGPVTFKNFPGEKPVLDGSGVAQDTGNGDKGGFYLFNRSYVRIEGFEIRAYRTNNPDNTPAGIWVLGSGRNIEIIGNDIHDIANTSIDGNAHGIAVYGSSAPASIRDLLIQGNRVHNNTLGFSEALVLNGNVERFRVLQNRVFANNNIGIDAIGFEGVSPDPAFDQARNGVIRGNTVFANSSAGNAAYAGDISAGGIYVDGGRDIVIEGNVSYSNDIGIEVASEHAGRGTSNITVRNNVIYRNAIGGILMGGYSTARGYADRIKVINNTLYENDRLQWGLGELLLQHDVRNTIIKNNILRANAQGRLIVNPFVANIGNVLDYNLYSAPPGASLRWQWKKVVHATIASWRTATGGDAHAVVADPMFVAPAVFNLHLQAASPAVDAGQTLAIAGSTDMDRGPRVTGARIDIGADERAP